MSAGSQSRGKWISVSLLRDRAIVDPTDIRYKHDTFNNDQLRLLLATKQTFVA